MKVECIKIVDDETGAPLAESAWLTIGKEYYVLSIFIESSNQVLFRLISDDGYTPTLNHAIQFKITDERLSSNWIVHYEQGLYLELTPKSWASPGFWEDYFDGDPLAVKKFETEKEIIFQSDS